MRVMSLLTVILLLVVMVWGTIELIPPKWEAQPRAQLIDVEPVASEATEQALETAMVWTLTRIELAGRITFADIDSKRLSLDLILPERSESMLWHDMWALGHDVFLGLPVKELWIRIFIQEFGRDQATEGQKRLWLATVAYRPDPLVEKKPEPWGEEIYRRLFSAEVQWMP